MLALSTGLPRLEIDGSIRALFPDSGKAYEDQREFSANFRGEPNIITVVRSDDIFQPEVLNYIRLLGEEIARIENIRSVRNLFTTRIAKAEGSGFRLEPLINEIPKNPEAIEKLREDVLSTPLSRNILVNRNGNAASIQGLLAYKKASKGFEEDVVRSIRVVIESSQKPPQVNEIYVAGGPVIATTITGHIWRDMLLLGPIALLLIAIASFFCFRRAVAPLLVFSTGTLSVLATLGFMGHTGIAINPIISVVVILILVVGCTEDLHILAEFLLGIGRKLNRKEALHALSKTIVLALVLTSASTALGFLTLLNSPVPGLRDFGTTCATGIILNFLITLLISPAILQISKASRTNVKAENSGRKSLFNRAGLRTWPQTRGRGGLRQSCF